MTETTPKGFFAYPSDPPMIGECVRGAVSEINRSGVANITTWEGCSVSGKLVVQRICDQIRDSDLFCADITGLNANVVFELGYAVAANKRIWLLMDESIADSMESFRRLRVLTTVGYSPYTNATGIAQAFYRDQPFADLHATVFQETVQPNLEPSSEPSLLYLKSRHDTQASLQIGRRVDKSPISTVVDDPRESSVQTLTWYGTKAYGALAVVCHLTGIAREGARLHNAQYALVAGMAYGFNRPLLMLAEGDYLAPLDYRDLLKNYQTAAEAASHLDQWLLPIEEAWHANQVAQRHGRGPAELAVELKGLQVGEYVAENEGERLVDEYFLETSVYSEAEQGTGSIFVGRKGSGKTANLLKLQSVLSRDARNLVCLIKPPAYELQGLVKLLSRYKELDAKGYAIESLWKFLIYTEIANAAAAAIEKRPAQTVVDVEQQLIDLLDQGDGMLRGDFAVRLERAVEALLLSQPGGRDDDSIEKSRVGISEALHEGVLGQLRKTLGLVLASRNRVAILIDNLDKAWDKQRELGELAHFLLGLLGVADRVGRDLRSDSAHYRGIRVSLAIFLRSDIYYSILESAREPDKIVSTKMRWDDPELLMRVIEERFIVSHHGTVSAENLWERYFCAQVGGLSTKAYLLSRIMPRPRDLVYLVKAAIATAVNRRHASVEASDILEAVKQYSQYALDSILVENGIRVETLESIIYEFAGSTPCVDHDQVVKHLRSAGIVEGQIPPVLAHLCALSFLGVEVQEGEFRFAEDPQEHRRNEVLARRLAQTNGRDARYKINRPFWAFLELSDTVV